MLLSRLPLIMVRCLLETVLIECGLAFIIGIREKKDLLNVLLVNIITNPLLVISVFIINFRFGSSVSVIYEYAAEVIVFIAEGLIYLKVLNYRKINPFLVSLILNLASYSIGEVINKIIY